MLKKIIALLLAVSVFAAPVQAQLKYLPGIDYHVLKESLDNDPAPKVAEFFWYGCGHCYDFEPIIAQWLQETPGKSVHFEKIPAVTPYWKGGAQLYYTAHALNLPDIDKKVFDAVHKQNNQIIIFEKNAAIDFLVANGANRADAEKTWNSLAVKQKIHRAQQLFDRTGLDGVPSFLVNGIYTVHILKGFPQLLEEISYLIHKDDETAIKNAAPPANSKDALMQRDGYKKDGLSD